MKQRQVSKGELVILYPEDLNQNQHWRGFGFSIYRGVLVQWDEDHDHRVLTFLDGLSENERSQLLIVAEAEGALCLTWKNFVPQGLDALKGGVEVGGDVWGIVESKVLQ